MIPTDTKAAALICFAEWKESTVFPFRDELFNNISSSIGGADKYYVGRQQGAPTTRDSYIWLFAKADEDRVSRFNERKHPGLLANLFRKNEVRLWEEEHTAIMALQKVSIETSHDHPCIELYSAFHSKEKLSELISAAALQQNVAMDEVLTLPDMASVIMSNALFPLDD